MLHWYVYIDVCIDVCIYLFMYVYNIAARGLLKSWVRIPPGASKFVCCKCCVLSGRGLCDELITHQEEYYRLRCVVVCDLENLKNEKAMTRFGLQRHKKMYIILCMYVFNIALICIFEVCIDVRMYLFMHVYNVMYVRT
jgi:hypothetical protein